MISSRHRLLAAAAGLLASLVLGVGTAGAATTSFADVRVELRAAATALDAVYADEEDDFTDEEGDDFSEGEEFDEELTDDEFFDDEEDWIDEEDLDLGADPFDDEDYLTIDGAAAQENLAHTERARALAQKLGTPKLKAKGMTAVMLQADDNLYEYEDLVEYVSESDQLFVVAALDASRVVRDRAADSVVKVAAKLPTDARAKLLGASADATDDGDADYLLEILAYDLAAEPTKDALEPALTAMIAHMSSLSARLAKLSAKLPRAERSAPRGAAQTVDAALAYLPGLAAELVDELEADGEQEAADGFCVRLGRLPIELPAGTCAP
jgi:hypothetical protein